MTNKSDVSGKYVHYKGGEYDVIGLAKHSETGERFVVYRPLYDDPEGDGLMVIRPEAMFFETIALDGVKKARFEKVED